MDNKKIEKKIEKKGLGFRDSRVPSENENSDEISHSRHRGRAANIETSATVEFCRSHEKRRMSGSETPQHSRQLLFVAYTNSCCKFEVVKHKKRSN